MATFKLEALLHFGTDLPVAVLRVDGNSGIYDVSGVRDRLRREFYEIPTFSNW